MTQMYLQDPNVPANSALLVCALAMVHPCAFSPLLPAHAFSPHQYRRKHGAEFCVSPVISCRSAESAQPLFGGNKQGSLSAGMSGLLGTEKESQVWKTHSTKL